MLNRKELADKLGITTVTLDKRRDLGFLPKHYMYPSEGLYAWDEEDIALFIECKKDIREYVRRKAAMDL